MSHEPDFTIKSGATAPSLLVQLLDGDAGVNLTGATVRVRIRSVDGGALLVDAPAAVVGDPLLGWVEYTWQPGDTATPGEYEAEWPVTFAGGGTEVFPTDEYTTIEIEPSLASDPAATLPALPDDCWPVNMNACSDLDNYSPSVRARAVALATQTLRLLTAEQVGGCPITVRPCSQQSCSTYWSGGVMQPMNWAGTWYNVCGCSGGCGHTSLATIELPGPVARVDEVRVDGVVVDPANYRVDGRRWLVRTDGLTWPISQNLEDAITEPGTFAVTYLRGREVDGLGAWAAGVLACEFAKAMTPNAKCRLPQGVREISRQGITMTISTGAFPDGLTGIREVDAYITSINPHALKTAPSIFSFDRRGPRVVQQ